MAPLLIEIAIAFIPGSDVIELFRSLNNGDKVGVAFAVGGLVVSAVGGSGIKGACKAAKKGFKTGLDNAGRLIVEKGGRVLARGKENVNKLLEEVGRLIQRTANLSNGKKLFDRTTESDRRKCFPCRA